MEKSPLVAALILAPMTRTLIALLFLLLGGLSAGGQTKTTGSKPPAQSTTLPSMPSEAEIGELVSKASEYVETYKATFVDAKPSLEKVPNSRFYDSAVHLGGQATDVISAIRKSGPTAVSLVTLIVILDDMDLNSAHASAQTMLVATEENRSDPKNHAMQDFQDITQAGKNCYDIAELLFHATLRFISVEETALRTLLSEHSK